MSFKVFVGSIPGDARVDELLRIFSAYARVVRVKLAFERKKNLCKGYGFVFCASRVDRERLLSSQGCVVFRDRSLSLREFQAGNLLRENRIAFNNRRIFVGNIPEFASTEQLRACFSVFGPIENIYLIKSEVPEEKKYGYVVFRREGSAKQALDSGSKIEVCNSRLRVEEFNGKRAYILKSQVPRIVEKDETNFSEDSGPLSFVNDLETYKSVNPQLETIKKITKSKYFQKPLLCFDAPSSTSNKQAAKNLLFESSDSHHRQRNNRAHVLYTPNPAQGRQAPSSAHKKSSISCLPPLHEGSVWTESPQKCKAAVRKEGFSFATAARQIPGEEFEFDRNPQRKHRIYWSSVENNHLEANIKFNLPTSFRLPSHQPASSSSERFDRKALDLAYK